MAKVTSGNHGPCFSAALPCHRQWIFAGRLPEASGFWSTVAPCKASIMIVMGVAVIRCKWRAGDWGAKGKRRFSEVHGTNDMYM